MKQRCLTVDMLQKIVEVEKQQGKTIFVKFTDEYSNYRNNPTFDTKERIVEKIEIKYGYGIHTKKVRGNSFEQWVTQDGKGAGSNHPIFTLFDDDDWDIFSDGFLDEETASYDPISGGTMETDKDDVDYCKDCGTKGEVKGMGCFCPNNKCNRHIIWGC